MQQLETSKQIVEEEQRCKRECKGRALAISRNVYRLRHTDVYYVESESSNDTYYFVKYKPDVLEFCSCKDYESNRATRCKHIFGLEYAIRLGTLKDVDKLPEQVKKEVTKSYTEDDYSF